MEEKGNSTIDFGPLLKLTAIQKLFIESNCVSNATVLSTYKNANVEKNAEFDTVCTYLEEKILPMLNNGMNLEQFANDVVRLDDESKKFICDSPYPSSAGAAEQEHLQRRAVLHPSHPILYFKETSRYLVTFRFEEAMCYIS